MKTRIHLFTLLSFMLAAGTQLFAQEEAPPEPWTQGASIGMDLSQLLQINPKVGAGQNRFGVGGALNYFAKYKKKRRAWDNTAGWQFGIQRLGTGLVALGNTEKIPFQKAIDELRFNTKYGYKAADPSKLFYTADLSFLSQLTKTFKGPPAYPGFFLSDITDLDPTYTEDPLLSQFFSPATITLSVGIDYKVSDKFGIYYSPLGGKFIIVANDQIAARGVHGNPVRGTKVDGRYADFDNVDAQMGSLLRMNFASTFAEEKVSLTAALTLYSNYLRDPQNIDVDWANELNVTLWKNFKIGLLLNIFYDHDVKVQISDWDFPSGIRTDIDGDPITARRVSITEQLLIKYARSF